MCFLLINDLPICGVVVAGHELDSSAYLRALLRLSIIQLRGLPQPVNRRSALGNLVPDYGPSRTGRAIGDGDPLRAIEDSGPVGGVGMLACDRPQQGGGAVALHRLHPTIPRA